MPFEKRDKEMIAIRPIIEIESKANQTALETFMHDCLRPILKLQHNTLVVLLSNAPHFKVDEVPASPQELRHNYISTFLQKNTGTRQLLCGIIVGCFTAQELTFYLNNIKQITKRMIEMIVVRYLSTRSKN
jgi:hypothetical protein